jgi:hypothetical protein
MNLIFSYFHPTRISLEAIYECNGNKPIKVGFPYYVTKVLDNADSTRGLYHERAHEAATFVAGARYLVVLGMRAWAPFSEVLFAKNHNNKITGPGKVYSLVSAWGACMQW